MLQLAIIIGVLLYGTLVCIEIYFWLYGIFKKSDYKYSADKFIEDCKVQEVRRKVAVSNLKRRARRDNKPD